MLTANAVSGAKEKYLSAGFDEFLSKPVVPQKLEHLIQTMLPEHLIIENTNIENTDTENADTENASKRNAAQLYEKGYRKSVHTPSQSTLEIPPDIYEKLPQTDGLDWQYAWMHLPDMDLLEFTIKEFYAQIDSAAQLLEQAFEKAGQPQYLEQYRIQVHAMKGLSAAVGILPLSGTAKILEYAARDGRLDVLSAVTPVFLEEWRSYRLKLKGVFGIGTEVKKEAEDISVILALVEMLRISMQQMDIDQADGLMHQLQEYAFDDETQAVIQQLAQAVTNLDADQVEHAADMLIRQMG